MEATLRECINDGRREGRTILLSSHLLAEAEALANRVTIIGHSKTGQTGTSRRRCAHRRLNLRP